MKGLVMAVTHPPVAAGPGPARHLRAHLVRPSARMALLAAVVAATEGALVHLGRTYGSTAAERAMRIPGDDIIADPVVVTNHAITIDAPPESVWPWLSRWRGGERVGTPPARSTGSCSRPTVRAPPRSCPSSRGSRSATSSPTAHRRRRRASSWRSSCRSDVLVLHSTSHLPAGPARDRPGSPRLVVGLPPHPDRRRPANAYLFRSRGTTSPWRRRLAAGSASCRLTSSCPRSSARREATR